MVVRASQSQLAETPSHLSFGASNNRHSLISRAGIAVVPMAVESAKEAMTETQLNCFHRECKKFSFKIKKEWNHFQAFIKFRYS